MVSDRIALSPRGGVRWEDVAQGEVFYGADDGRGEVQHIREAARIKPVCWLANQLLLGEEVSVHLQ